MMATIGEIEQLTKGFSAARDRLCETVQELEKEIQALKISRMPSIKMWVRIAKEKRDKLAAAIDASPKLFEKPRTVIFYGIKVGLEKAKGKIEWVSEEAVVRLIKKHFPEMVDVLIKKTEKPLKKPLGRLSVDDLKKLGVTVQETDDAVVIRPVDSEVDKLVDALLSEKDEEEGEAA